MFRSSKSRRQLISTVLLALASIGAVGTRPAAAEFSEWIDPPELSSCQDVCSAYWSSPVLNEWWSPPLPVCGIERHPGVELEAGVCRVTPPDAPEYDEDIYYCVCWGSAAQ